jgi:hypothetical protein
VATCDQNMLIHHRVDYRRFGELMNDDENGNICAHAPREAAWQEKAMARVPIIRAPWIILIIFIFLLTVSLRYYRQQSHARNGNGNGNDGVPTAPPRSHRV